MGNIRSNVKSGTEDSKNSVNDQGGAGDSPPQPLTANNLDILSQAGKLINELNPRIADLNQRTLRIEETQNNLVDKIHEGKERVTETLAIFVALFTFISINFSFFSNKCLTPEIFISLNLVLGGFLLIFIALVRVKGHLISNLFEIMLIFIVLVFIVIGVFNFKQDDYSNCKISEDQSVINLINNNKQPLVEQNFIPNSENKLSPTPNTDGTNVLPEVSKKPLP